MSARTQRRWIVLGQDGRHVTLGQAASPSAAEVEAAAAVLAAQGLAGWLATLEGDYWGRGRVELAPMQIIGTPVAMEWAAAVAAFVARRCTDVTPRGRGPAPTPHR